MMMFPAHNIPRQFAISCVESVCLEVTISCGWTLDINLFQLADSMCYRHPETSCFVKMGAHDNTNFCDREFVWRSNITAMLAATRQCGAVSG